MNVTFGSLGPTTRLFLARHVWIRRLTLAALAALAGGLVIAQLASVDAARDDWIVERDVPVAAQDHEPGDVVVWEVVTMPVVAIPVAGLADVDTGMRATQRIAAGSILTDLDVSDIEGPASLARDGEVVVPLSDPMLPAGSTMHRVGNDVVILSEGIELADVGRIVAIDADVVFVAVSADDAPAVAAAAQLRLASLAFPR